MKKYYTRSDLAMESLAVASKEKDYHREVKEIGGITVEKFEVLRKNENHSLDIGRYVEISFKDYENKDEIINQCHLQIKEFLLNELNIIDPLIMIVGLGNDTLTSDAIGPRSLKHIQATHHLDLQLRHQKQYYDIICVTPGVMAHSGVESADYLYSLKEEFKPDIMIVIDALCARSYEKVCRVIQMNNVGINPGSGIGNHRKAINKLTMDIPVIAIGVPTVIHVSSLVNEVFNLMEGYFKESLEPSSSLKVGKRNRYQGKLNEGQKEFIMGELGKLNEEKRQQLFHEVLSPLENQMILCDKQIDFDLEMMTKIISTSINHLRY
jgi:Germination protease.